MSAVEQIIVPSDTADAVTRIHHPNRRPLRLVSAQDIEAADVNVEPDLIEVLEGSSHLLDMFAQLPVGMHVITEDRLSREEEEETEEEDDYPRSEDEDQEGAPVALCARERCIVRRLEARRGSRLDHELDESRIFKI